MTDFRSGTQRARDQNDHFERHIWGELEYVQGAGAKMRVKGTDTEDLELPVLFFGSGGFNLPKDTDAEVMAMAGSADTNQKFAVPTLPFETQRQWAEGAGGIQHPMNGDRAVEINDNETWLKDGTFVLGDARAVTVTVNGGNVTIASSGPINFNSPSLTHNGVEIGSTHVHSGVTPGAGITGAPV